jgi:heat-inducible transcriptional repressor
MEVLNPREKTVLDLIMENYITFAIPIGSRTVAKAMGNELSSATIRNVMADLEERGFLQKRHAVAGRVPTYKAYRYYVNGINVLQGLGKRELQIIENVIRPRYAQVEEIMEDASKALAAMSRFTSIVVEPRVDTMIFKEVEFVRLTRFTILVVFVTSSGLVHTRLVATKEELGLDVLESMKDYMNGKFSGTPFYVLKEKILEDVRRDREDYRRLLRSVKDALDTLVDTKDRREVYIEGASKIIGVPEFTDIGRLKELFQTLERKEKLLRLLDNCMRKEGINVVIGTETEIREMRDMSIVTSTFRISEKSYGVLGVIGPIRMNYAKVIPVVEYTANTVTEILRMA